MTVSLFAILVPTMPSARQLALGILADPQAALARPTPWRTATLCRLCDEIGKILWQDPDHGRRIASIALRLACRARDRRAIGRAWCALGAALRYADRLLHAEICYTRAFAEGIAEQEPEIWRRRAILRLYQEQPNEARAFAHLAVRGAMRIGDPAGEGRARLARGLARKHLGDRDGAYADYRAALDLIPRSDTLYYLAALQNLATFLAAPESTPTQHEDALAKIAEARHTVYKQRGYRVLRIRLRWVELLSLHRLGRLPPSRVRQGLERVVAVLSELGMPQDAAAAAADAAELCAEHCLSVDALENAVLGLCDRIENSEAELSRSAVVPLTRLRRAAEAVDPRPAVREAARELRHLSRWREKRAARGHARQTA